MPGLKSHIIKKYNDAAMEVIKYYNLNIENFNMVPSGILQIHLTNKEIPSGAEYIPVLRSTYKYLLPFEMFQRNYLGGNRNNEHCIKYLGEINNIIKIIRKENKNS